MCIVLPIVWLNWSIKEDNFGMQLQQESRLTLTRTVRNALRQHGQWSQMEIPTGTSMSEKEGESAFGGQDSRTA